jgi:hypothetical protein
MATPIQDPYQYLPITGHEGIRLIVLQPSPDKAAPVQCSISHTTLRQARDDIYEHYTALSYVWGDSNETTSISVDGYHPLQVTKNLECALRYLRDEKRVSHVWADGVCINQRDDDEKAKQVQQMGRVYEVAHHTVIFLGECDPAEEAVLTGLLSCYKKGILYPEANEGIRVLKQILARPWFYRIWILQELVVSHDPRLQIGNLRFPWWTLSRLKALFPPDIGPTVCFSHATKGVLGEFSTCLQGGFDVVSQMNNIKWIFERSRVKSRCGIEESLTEMPVGREAETPIEEHGINNLLSILEARRGFQASDPRDRIFAHLGLVDDIYFTVDYRTTYTQLFLKFAQQHILDTKSYEIFAHVEDVELQQRMKGLPSWVPDWTYRDENPRRQLLRYPLFEQERFVRTRGKLIPNMQRLWRFFDHEIRDFQDNTISSKAYHLASISKLSQVLDTTTYPGSSDYDQYYASISNQLGVTFEDIFHKLHRTTGDAEHTIQFLAQELDASGASILDGRRLAILEEQQPSKVSSLPRGRRMAVVPAFSKIGDLVCFLEDLTVPLVFRHTKTEHQREQGKGLAVNLIGPCLIGDFMKVSNVKRVMEALRLSEENTEFITIY